MLFAIFGDSLTGLGAGGRQVRRVGAVEPNAVLFVRRSERALHEGLMLMELTDNDVAGNFRSVCWDPCSVAEGSSARPARCREPHLLHRPL